MLAIFAGIYSSSCWPSLLEATGRADKKPHRSIFDCARATYLGSSRRSYTTRIKPKTSMKQVDLSQSKRWHHKLILGSSMTSSTSSQSSGKISAGKESVTCASITLWRQVCDVKEGVVVREGDGKLLLFLPNSSTFGSEMYINGRVTQDPGSKGV